MILYDGKTGGVKVLILCVFLCPRCGVGGVVVAVNYPLSGSTAIDLGSFSSDLKSVFCMLPSKLANSIESLSAFVQ